MPDREHNCPAQFLPNQNKFWDYLTTGIVPEGMEWLKENKTTRDELRPYLKEPSKAGGGGYLESLEQLSKDESKTLHKNARVIAPDLNGPLNRCTLIALGSYPTLTNKDRPMMLGFDGQYLDPRTLAAIVKPWANILFAMCNIPFKCSYNLLSKITLIYDYFAISSGATYASDKTIQKNSRG
jgi:hypothetical protein